MVVLRCPRIHQGVFRTLYGVDGPVLMVPKVCLGRPTRTSVSVKVATKDINYK